MDKKEFENFNIIMYKNRRGRPTAMKIVDLLTAEIEIVVLEGSENLATIMTMRNEAIEKLINKRV
jgi:hypothetical protein